MAFVAFSKAIGTNKLASCSQIDLFIFIILIKLKYPPWRNKVKVYDEKENKYNQIQTKIQDSESKGNSYTH